MYQFVVFALAFALSAPSAFASQFAPATAPKNANLKKLHLDMKGFENSYLGVYKVVQQTAAHGRTAEQVRLAVIKESMHRYMCSFFDESIDLGKAPASEHGVAAVMSDLDMRNNASDAADAKLKAFERDLAPVLHDRTLDVYSGGASGNNTMGEIMGVYDIANDQVLYFGYTNCGSDD